MSKEFLNSMKELAEQRGMTLETVLAAFEDAFLGAARKSIKFSRNVSVTINRNNGDICCTAKLFIVKKVEQTEREISLRDVQQRFPDRNYTEDNLGEEIDWNVDPEDFGRITAQNARQAFQQKLRQIEKQNVCELYKDQLYTLLTGTVHRVDRNDVLINFEQAEGVMHREDRIPGEEYEIGDIITALLVEISSDKSGPMLKVSRSDEDFVVKLFEREVSEIADGQVVIKGVARDPGHRSKIAVTSSDPRVDPVGACVGMRGTRVKTIVRELNGEKVDIVNWDPDIRKFVENALKPAKITNMTVDDAHHSIHIEVPKDQLSLSIGKKGLNASLAGHLTGWKLEVVESKEETEASEPGFEEQIRNAVETLSAALGIEADKAETLVKNGYTAVDVISSADESDLAALDGFDSELAASVKAKAVAL